MIFRIYFDQVNQEMYQIEAKSEFKAIEKARREWRAIHNNPEPSCVEAFGEDD